MSIKSLNIGYLLSMSFPGKHGTRYIKFNINKGLCEIIGRASNTDPDRKSCKNNLFYDEKSLSRNHAVLHVRKFESGIGAEIDLYDYIRIFAEDLNSTHGIIDLQGDVQGYPKIIDLKNGERLGLVHMKRSVVDRQGQAARLKLQIQVQHINGEIWELVVRDVTYEDSPKCSGEEICDEGSDCSTKRLKCFDFKGEGYLSECTDVFGWCKKTSYIVGSDNSLLGENESIFRDNGLIGGFFEFRNGPQYCIMWFRKAVVGVLNSVKNNFILHQKAYFALYFFAKNKVLESLWGNRSVILSILFGFILGFIFGAARLE